MKIEYGKKAMSRNGDEVDYLYAKHLLCVFFNSPNPAKKTKKRMKKRLRQSQKLIIKLLLNEQRTI